MSAYAMFALKDPSMLAFDKRRQGPTDNFRSISGIDHVPCDSQMRTILDPTDPEHLRPSYNELFHRLQRAKVLEDYPFFDGCYLVALGGTNDFSSAPIHCPCGTVTHHRGGSVTYSHQLLGAAIVHPDFKEVIPLMPEPIIKQDGSVKNDGIGPMTGLRSSRAGKNSGSPRLVLSQPARVCSCSTSRSAVSTP